MRKLLFFTIILNFIVLCLWGQKFDKGFTYTPEGIIYSFKTTNSSNAGLIISASFMGDIDIDPDPQNEIMLSSPSGIKSYICMYSPDGDYRWHILLGNDNALHVLDIATDADDNIYVCGSFSGTVDFDPTRGTHNLSAIGKDIFVAQYSSNGLLVEAFNYGTANDETGRFIKLTKTEVYVAGDQKGSKSAGTVLVHKLSKIRDVLWTLKIDVTGGDVAVASIDVDNNGNLYVAGTYSGEISARIGAGSLSLESMTQSSFLLKCGSSGNLEWIDNVAVNINKIAVENDMVNVAGSFTGTVIYNKGAILYRAESNGQSDNIFLQFTSDGNFHNLFSFGSPANDHINGFYFDSDGNLLVVGGSSGLCDYNPNGSPVLLDNERMSGYVASYSSDYELNWVGAFPALEHWSDCIGVQQVEGNRVFVTGRAMGEFDIDSDTAAVRKAGRGGFENYFISVLRPYFTQTNIVRIEFANAISVDVDSDARTVDVLMPFGTDVSNIEAIVALSEGAALTGEMPSDYTNTVELEVVAEDGVTKSIWTIIVSVEEEQTSLFQTNSAKNIKVYPNPVSGVVNIKVQNEQAVNYKLLSFNGALIKEGSVLNGIVDLYAHPAGLYLLEVFNTDTHQTFKLHINE